MFSFIAFKEYFEYRFSLSGNYWNFQSKAKLNFEIISLTQKKRFSIAETCQTRVRVFRYAFVLHLDFIQEIYDYYYSYYLRTDKKNSLQIFFRYEKSILGDWFGFGFVEFFFLFTFYIPPSFNVNECVLLDANHRI